MTSTHTTPAAEAAVPGSSPAARAKRGDFTGATPVITTDTGQLLGYAVPADVPPLSRCGHPDRDYWTWALPDGYVSQVNHSSRWGAAAELAVRGRASNAPGPVPENWHNLDLMAVLHGLTARYTPAELAAAAVAYAAVVAPREGVDEADLSGTVDRRGIVQVITSMIGPQTAADMLTAYDVTHGVTHDVSPG